MIDNDTESITGEIFSSEDSKGSGTTGEGIMPRRSRDSTVKTQPESSGFASGFVQDREVMIVIKTAGIIITGLLIILTFVYTYILKPMDQLLFDQKILKERVDKNEKTLEQLKENK